MSNLSNVKVEKEISIIDNHIVEVNKKLKHINEHLNYMETAFNKFLGEIVANKEDENKSNKTEISKIQLLDGIAEKLYNIDYRLENICITIDKIL